MTTPDYSFPNITPWTNSQVRNGPFPLDRYSVFSSLADAEEYAAGVLAYEGQQIAVAGAGGVSAFMLDSKAESGMRMLPDISAVAAELSNCGYLTSVPAAGDDTLGGVKLGYETDAANKNYALTVDADTGKAYVNVPWESGGGGGGGTTVEVDGVTIKKNTSNQIYVASVPLSVRSAISATSSNFGTVKLGYPQNERNYPLQLSTDGKAYVSVPWTDTPTPASAISADLTSVFQAKGSYLTAVPAATGAAIGGIKTGYSGSGKNYPLSLDADSKAFVHVPWESGSNVDVDNDTLSTNASGKLYVRQILSSQVSGLGTFAAKSSLLSTDIPDIDTSIVKGLGNLATKDESELDFASKATTLAGYGITDAKIENGVSITLGDTTISVLTAHQDITGKANLTDILTASVEDSTKTKLGLKSDLSIDVLTAHQSLAEYVTTSKLTGFTTDTDAHNYQV